MCLKQSGCLVKPMLKQKLRTLCRHQWTEFHDFLYLGGHHRPFWPLNARTWESFDRRTGWNWYLHYKFPPLGQGRCSNHCLATAAFGQKQQQAKKSSICWWQRRCHSHFHKAFQTSEITPCFSSHIWLILTWTSFFLLRVASTFLSSGLQ